MLAFARRQALQPKPIDIHRMVANMESILRRTLSADIDLEVIQSREDCTALVDLTQLENALLNLCVNAGDAMPEGGKLYRRDRYRHPGFQLCGTRTPKFTPGQYILISVSDTGLPGHQPGPGPRLRSILHYKIGKGRAWVKHGVGFV